MKNQQYRLDQSIMKVLSKAYRQSNRSRNRILIIVIALVILSSFLTYSIVKGKVSADTNRLIKEEGCVATATLSNGTQEQAEKLLRSKDIAETGSIKEVGWIYRDEEKWTNELYAAAVTDNAAFDQFYKPAFNNVTGIYPVRQYEIMLSEALLESLGIQNPEVGMEIPLGMEWNSSFNWNSSGIKRTEGIHRFKLSGFYESISIEKDYAFLSQKWLADANVDFYPNQILILPVKESISVRQTETILYKEIDLEAEQIINTQDSAAYRALEKTTGGYTITYILTALLLLAMFLLIYSILRISLSKILREYGLLEVLGVTPKQLKSLLYKEIAYTGIKGCLSGAALCIVLMPLISYLLIGVVVFKWKALAVIVFVTALFLLIDTTLIILKLEQLSPMKALLYQESNQFKQKDNKKNRILKGNITRELAWRQIILSKKRLCFMITGLFMACFVALCSIVLAMGSDLGNAINKKPDFQLELSERCTDVFDFADIAPEFQFVDESEIEEIAELAGISIDRIVVDRGTFMIPDSDVNSVFEHLYRAKWKSNLLIPIAQKDIKSIKKLSEKENIYLDTASVESGNGAVIVHKKLMNEEAREAAKKRIGEEYKSYSVTSGANGLGFLLEEEGIGIALRHSGYLDVTNKFFPDIYLPWETSDEWIYVLVNEETFGNFLDNWQKVILRLSFQVDTDKEEEVKKNLKEWVSNYNRVLKEELRNEIFEIPDMISLTSKSDVLAENRQQIILNRSMMGVICFTLMTIGITGFINTMTVSMVSRQKEIKALHQIGMSWREIKNSITWEGIYYFLILTAALFSAGNIFLLLIGKTLADNLPGFIFYYPWQGIAGLLFVIFMCCISIPRIIFENVKQSL